MSIKDFTTGIQHIGIPTKNMEATKEFYKKIGFEPILETLADDAKEVAFLKLENLVIEAYEEKVIANKPGAIDHIAIGVKDIEAAYKEICSLGLNTTNDEIHFLPFWEKGTKYFTIKGPNEEKVEFSQIL